MATKRRKFEIHKLTISGMIDGTDYRTIIRDSRRKIKSLGDAVWEHGGKSHALQRIDMGGKKGERLRLRFLSYKTGYRPDILDTVDFSIEPNPLSENQTGVDYTHVVLSLADDERWLLVVEKIQGGIFPSAIGLYIDWMLYETGIPEDVRISEDTPIVVSVEPEPSETFIQRINDLTRITKASLRIVRPNPGFDDLDSELAAEADDSDAAHAEVGMSARRGSTLSKVAGIIAHIKTRFNERNLGHAAIAGEKDGAPDSFTTEQLGQKAYRNVELDERGQVRPTDAYNQAEDVLDDAE
jgi:hypothetical protein